MVGVPELTSPLRTLTPEAREHSRRARASRERRETNRVVQVGASVMDGYPNAALGLRDAASGDATG